MVFCIASFKACQSDSISHEVRQANKKYMEDVSTDYKENSKKFWSFIKSKGQEWTGVAPLKSKDVCVALVSFSKVLFYQWCFVLRLSKLAKVIQYLSFRCFEMCFQMILDLPVYGRCQH
jgi:hypothetical protein